MKTLQKEIQQKIDLCVKKRHSTSATWLEHYCNGKIRAYEEILQMIEQ